MINEVESLPTEFYGDFAKVADDEAKVGKGVCFSRVSVMQSCTYWSFNCDSPSSLGNFMYTAQNLWTSFCIIWKLLLLAKSWCFR